ncbi:MAG: DUF547 domain-containing protein [Phycisphaerae bacterium]
MVRNVIAMMGWLAAAGCGPSATTQLSKDVVSEPSDPSFEKTWDRHRFDHGLWDAVVRRFVDDHGLVDYADIGSDARYREYLYRLAHTDAGGLADDHERLAFWVNAYNALTIKGVLLTLPADRAAWPSYSIKDQKIDGRSLWKGMVFEVGGARWTLDGIEHGILRKQDGLRDPRIHVAIVCAARGCPRLWNRAYEPAQIDEQLADAVHRYLTDRRQCRIDVAGKTIKLSKIFDWYGGDFVDSSFSPHAPSVPAFLARYVGEAAKLSRALSHGEWEIDYFDYDWKLNLAP